MDSIEVMLGDTLFEIKEQSINQGEHWRERLDGPLDDIVDMVMGLDTELDSVADLQAVLPRVKGLLMGSVKQIAELVCAWDASFEQRADYILDHATGSQVMEAFIVMVQMAFPFGEALTQLVGMSRGLGGGSTLTSSPALNGAGPSTSLAKQQ